MLVSSCSGGDRDGNQGRGVVGKDNGIRGEGEKWELTEGGKCKNMNNYA